MKQGKTLMHCENTTFAYDNEFAEKLAPPTPDMSKKLNCCTPRLLNVIEIMMIKIDAGCIPLIELFFSNMETYFFLDIMRTLKVTNL